MLTEKALTQTAQSYVEVGKGLLQQGCFEEALSNSHKALHFKANYFEAHHLIGEIYSKQQRWNECAEIYRKVIKLHPQNAQAYVSLGDALRNGGKTAQALKVCRRAERLNLSSPGLYRLLGNLLEGEQQYEQATHYYHKFLELKPKSAWGYVFLARSLQKQRQFKEVSQCCEQAMKHEQVIPDIFRLKAKALRQMNLLDEAM